MGSSAVVPRHIGVIMDGNRRWAEAHGTDRIVGHEKGIEALRRTVELCGNAGVRIITAYAFSSENWSRPKWEVEGLFALFGQFLVAERQELIKNRIRLTAIGRRDRYPLEVLRRLEETEQLTREFDGVHLRLAVDYGGRDEITAAARTLAESVRRGELNAEDITEDRLQDLLHPDGIPDPDLIIRTANEQRLSNFLLWQSCYAELHFCPTLWPDFGRADVERALADYARRERRYGGRPEEEPVAPPTRSPQPVAKQLAG